MTGGRSWFRRGQKPAPAPTRLHLESDGEVLKWMLSRLSRKELDQFTEEFSAQQAKIDSPEGVKRFNEWWASWILSMRLNVDEDFRLQMKDSEARVRAGEMGDPVGAEDLKRLLPSE